MFNGQRSSGGEELGNALEAKACLLRDNISSHKQEHRRRSNAVTHTREVCGSSAARLGFDFDV